MIDVLIFSKDRPAQLDLLLTSIERYAPKLYRRAMVLWRSPQKSRIRGAYEIVASAHRNVFWREEHKSFERSVWEWLDWSGRTVSFLVDDDIFFAPAARPTRLPFTYRRPATVQWRHANGPEHDEDDRYPLALDGNVYRKDTLIPLLDFHFGNPTQLEAGLAANAARFRPETVYSAGQCLVGIPANVVSESSGNPHMGLDPLEMNERYLAGERIDLDATLAGVEITKAHQEIEYVWR